MCMSFFIFFSARVLRNLLPLKKHGGSECLASAVPLMHRQPYRSGISRVAATLTLIQ